MFYFCVCVCVCVCVCDMITRDLKLSNSGLSPKTVFHIETYSMDLHKFSICVHIKLCSSQHIVVNLKYMSFIKH